MSSKSRRKVTKNLSVQKQPKVGRAPGKRPTPSPAPKPGTVTSRALKPATPAKAVKATPTAAPVKPGVKAPLVKAAKARDGQFGCLDAAVMVLGQSGKPMRCKPIVEQAIARKLWSTGGKTPSATLYAAVIREIRDKGSSSRFVKKERGLFALRGKGA
ncbi:MAG: hypothetical protein JNK58_10440 [Phycisphaerae bacterium]|nr:hypothetical protein [Phycisphaerae bacterium]